MGNYVLFTEENDWEGETWSFLLPWEGNEVQLKILAERLREERLERLSVGAAEADFTLDLDLIPESDAEALVRHTDTGCLAFFNLVKGTFTCPDFTDSDDVFYKGRIEEYFND